MRMMMSCVVPPAAAPKPFGCRLMVFWVPLTLASEDYLNPIIADADTGHGGITATMKLAKMFIENGAAGIHIEVLGGGCLLVSDKVQEKKLAGFFEKAAPKHHNSTIKNC